MIKRFFECYLPVTCCNLKCDYCYVPQIGWEQGRIKRFKYSIEVMLEALSVERLGGMAYFSICGGGETLMHPDLLPLVTGLLKAGHCVNLTNNGTYSRGIDAIVNTLTKDQIQRLHFAFSLHWDELVRLGLLDEFARNVNKVRTAGASFLVQINLCDSYVRQSEQIKRYCIANFGAMPQVAATRREGNRVNDPRRTELYTDMSVEAYKAAGDFFKSPLFEFTMKNFNRKIDEFCYAGKWSYCLELSEGVLKPCYCNGPAVRIFDQPTKPLPENPVGCHCHHKYCVNSSHFLSLGVIPTLYQNVSYADLRDRPEAGWYNSCLKDELSRKLSESNKQYNELEKFGLELRSIIGRILARIRRIVGSGDR